MAPTGRVMLHGGLAVVAVLSSAGRARRDPARGTGVAGCCRAAPAALARPHRHRPLPRALADLRVDRRGPHRPVHRAPARCCASPSPSSPPSLLQLGADRLLHPARERERPARRAARSPGWARWPASRSWAAPRRVARPRPTDRRRGRRRRRPTPRRRPRATAGRRAADRRLLRRRHRRHARGGGQGVGHHDRRHHRGRRGVADRRCGLDRDGVARGPVFPTSRSRPRAPAGRPPGPRRSRPATPDVVVLVTGISEVADHQVDPAGPWVAPGDPATTTSSTC